MGAPLEVLQVVQLHLGLAHHQLLHPVIKGGLYSKGFCGVKGELGVICFLLNILINMKC